MVIDNDFSTWWGFELLKSSQSPSNTAVNIHHRAFTIDVQGSCRSIFTDFIRFIGDQFSPLASSLYLTP